MNNRAFVAVAFVVALVASACVAAPADDEDIAEQGVALTAAPDAKQAAPSSLAAGATLTSGQSVSSPDGHYVLVMQTDGNLVLYYVAASWIPPTAIWASNTAGSGPNCQAVNQASDGNFVVYCNGVAVWSSGQTGGAGTIAVQNDGNVVQYIGDKPVWATNTAGVKSWGNCSCGRQFGDGGAIYTKSDCSYGGGYYSFGGPMTDVECRKHNGEALPNLSGLYRDWLVCKPVDQLDAALFGWPQYWDCGIYP